MRRGELCSPAGPTRKRMRLKNYDYSSKGAYFVTICIKDRSHMLGAVRMDELFSLTPHMQLSLIGEVVETEMNRLSRIYDHIYLDSYVIMPNHIHMIICIGSIDGRAQLAPTPTLSHIIQQWKGVVTKKIGRPIWQKGFHEHIIRNEADYLSIAQYIENNALLWEGDCYNNNS